MAFMSRGNFPSIENIDIGDNDSNKNGNSFHRGPYYYGRIYYYVPLDNTYVIMQIVVALIILIVGVIAFIITYKSPIIDPIENIKKLFINIHLIIIAILLGITFIINYLSKDESKIIKKLFVLTTISIITMITFFGIKLNLDATYTKEKFEEFYSAQNIEDKTSQNDILKQKIDIGITGVRMKTEKEYYVDECLKLYEIFTTKAYSTLGLHLLLNILLIYQVLKVSKIQEKKEQMNKDDIILFDEEQNIKF